MAVILCTDSTVGINTTAPHYTLAIHNSYDNCSLFLEESTLVPDFIGPLGGILYTSSEDFFYKSNTSTINLSQTGNNVTALLDIPFITQAANSLLPEAQPLGNLTTGILKNTVVGGAGTLSTASAGVDYYAPSLPHTLTINNLSNNCDIYLQNSVNLPSIPSAGGGILYTRADDLFYAGNSRTLNLSKGTAALSTKYIVQQPNPDLPNAQSLSTLTTGLLKNTTTTGALSIAASGVDYYGPGTPYTLTLNNISSTCDLYLQNTATVPSIPSAGGGVLYTLADDLFYSGKGRFVNLSAAADAIGATYITQTASSFLQNEQSLGSLPTGLLKNTVTSSTGVLSSALASPLNSITGDYYAPGSPTYIFDQGLVSPFNLFVGWISPMSNRLSVTGLANLGMGIRCLELLTSGNSNTCLGANTASNVTTGSDNTTLGRQTLQLAQTGIAGNTAIGRSAGALRSSYTNCTFLGFGADATAPGLTNASAIGMNASVSTSNSLVLGSGANVGIGTSSPANKLHVVGTIQQKGIVTNYTGTDIIRGQAGIQTTTNALTAAFSIPIPTAPPGCLKLSASFAAIQNTSASGASGNIETGLFYNGTTSTIQGPTGFSIQGPVLWGGNVTVSVVGTNLNINVTGITGQTLNWVIYYEYFTVRNVIT